MPESDQPAFTLEDIPSTPREIEELVAALFQASGYFVEKQVEESGTPNVLELDVVATRYEDEVEIVLGEAKSGRWGFSDVFKVLGWMVYLGIERGRLFVAGDRPLPEIEGIHERVGPLGVQVIPLGDFSDAERRFREAGLGEPFDETAISIWRVSYWAERELLAQLQEAAGGESHTEGPRAVKDYLKLIHNEVFFESDSRFSADRLYGAYQEHPRLALGVARELDGRGFDPMEGGPPSPIFRRALFGGRYPTVQAAFYVEHRARLAIMKAVVDHLCLESVGTVADDDFINSLYLPQNALAAMQELRERPNFRRYPLFWQVFLWGFGGLYLVDREEEEFEWLSHQTGLPADEILSALDLYDRLFPLRDGASWLARPGRTHCRMMKMFPAPLRGVGALHRKIRYQLEAYREFGYDDYTTRDLARSHNCLVELLADS